MASARMTNRGGGSSDDEYCGRKSHTAALRVAASPVLRVFNHTSSSCCLAALLKGGGIDGRMASSVVAVVPEFVVVIVCRSIASGRVLVRNGQISLCYFVLDVLLIAADC